MKKHPSPPTNPTCYPLGPALDFLQRLWQLNHALETRSNRMEQRLGVTAKQRLMIRCIGKYPGLTSGILASILHVDPGTVSTALNRLEIKGLLERRRDPRDKRRTTIGLTAKGHAIDCLDTATVESAVEQLLAATHQDDVNVTIELLKQLTRFLETDAST